MPAERNRLGEYAARPADYGRRDLLRGAVGLGLLLGLPSPSAGSEDGGETPVATQASVRRRVEVGATGVRVPDIGFGTFALDGDVELVRYALDRGITHFDTAEGYKRGRSEETLGRALGAQRDAVTLTTKFSARADETREQLMGRLEGSLRRLRTDRVDFVLNHAVDEIERVRNPEWPEFAERAKAAGKLRFAGMSGHGPHLGACLTHALENELVDLILVAYNYVQSPDWFDHARRYWEQFTGGDWVALQPELPALLERAQSQGVGVMVMKTLRGARRNDMRPYERDGGTFSQAALRWVLSDPRVDSLVITMRDRSEVDEYLAASGSGPTSADLEILARYEALNRSSQCVQGCGVCLGACPESVAISDVLRMRMYAVDYGEPEIARREYASLAGKASACAGCAAPCLGSCPAGIPIPELTREAHRQLG